MTRYSDNIYSGNTSITSAMSSRSAVTLTKTFNFNSTTGSSTQGGTFPSNTQNLMARLYITAQGSATTSDKITVSAGGVDLLTIDQFGSANGLALQTTTSLARFTIVASACAAIIPPSPSNQQETPFNVTYVKSSANKTGSCQVQLVFNRADTAFPAPGTIITP